MSGGDWERTCRFCVHFAHAKCYRNPPVVVGFTVPVSREGAVVQVVRGNVQIVRGYTEVMYGHPPVSSSDTCGEFTPFSGTNCA